MVSRSVCLIVVCLIVVCKWGAGVPVLVDDVPLMSASMFRNASFLAAMIVAVTCSANLRRIPSFLPYRSLPFLFRSSLHRRFICLRIFDLGRF